jgi:trans-aconitate methyltransferase
MVVRFDACADTYDANAAPQRAFAARVAGFIQPRPNEEVLELGAGTGALTRHLVAATAPKSVLATDVSSAMVALGQASVPEARWEQLDAFQEPLPPASLQVSSGLLQWAENPVRVLQLWRNALAPAGRMVHAFPAEPCLAEWRAIVHESPLEWRDETAWLNLFARAGLNIVRKEHWIDYAFFPSSLELVRSLHHSGVTGHARLGAGRLRQALRAYDTRHRESRGVFATWAWLAVEAVVSL